MKMSLRIFALVGALVLAGCASNKVADYGSNTEQEGGRSALSDQQLIRTARVELEVVDIDTASSKMTDLIAGVAGYVLSSNQYDDRSAHMTLKIPQDRLDGFVDQLVGVGKVTSKSLTSRNVTEEVIDVEAKLKNLKIVRERYRELMASAKGVTEIMSVERELSRLQTEIDAIEGKSKALKNDVEFSEVSIALKEKRLLGPIGLLFKGLFWTVEKLFVIK